MGRMITSRTYSTDRQRLARGLVRAARRAGRVILEIYAGDFSRRRKADGSPVTEADTAAERVIIEALGKLAPDIPVISEENEISHAARCKGCFFLVDPIDGTKEFIARNGEFTVNIAFVEEGRPVLGVVYAPALDELYHVDADGHAWRTKGRHRRPITARGVPKGGKVALVSRSHMDAETKAFIARHNVKETRNAGSSLKFCLIARGDADLYPRFGPTMEWDTAAGQAVLAAAGGEVTMLDGSPFLYGKTDKAFLNPGFLAWGRRA